MSRGRGSMPCESAKSSHASSDPEGSSSSCELTLSNSARVSPSRVSICSTERSAFAARLYQRSRLRKGRVRIEFEGDLFSPAKSVRCEVPARPSPMQMRGEQIGSASGPLRSCAASAPGSPSTVRVDTAAASSVRRLLHGSGARCVRGGLRSRRSPEWSDPPARAGLELDFPGFRIRDPSLHAAVWASSARRVPKARSRRAAGRSAHGEPAIGHPGRCDRAIRLVRSFGILDTTTSSILRLDEVTGRTG